jgi:hypothetical protein
MSSCKTKTHQSSPTQATAAKSRTVQPLVQTSSIDSLAPSLISTSPEQMISSRQGITILQRTIGNRAVGRLLQTKLKVGKPGDKYEQEADRVAERVVKMPLPVEPPVQSKPIAPAISRLVQRQEENEDIQAKPIIQTTVNEQKEEIKRKRFIQLKTEQEKEAVQAKIQLKETFDEKDFLQTQPLIQLQEEEKLQKSFIMQQMSGEEKELQHSLIQSSPDVQLKGASSDSHSATSHQENSINASRGSGSPLPPNTRNYFESRMGADFSSVRIHNDSNASSLSQSLNAQAFTVGNEIYFNKGKFDTGTSAGKGLIAHELAHTVQQGASPLVQGKRDPATHINSEPSIQRFDLGETLSNGASWVGNQAGNATKWAGEKVANVASMGADFFLSIVEQFAPPLANIITNGPESLIQGVLKTGIGNWVQSLVSGIDISVTVENLKNSLSGMFTNIQKTLNGDPSSCKSFSETIDGMYSFISKCLDNPAIQAVKNAFSYVTSMISRISDFILAPLFDTVMQIGGGIFSGIKELAGTISGWAKSIKNFHADAWKWVMEQIGITSQGEDGIWNYLKRAASKVWDSIKATFQTVIGPIKTLLKVLLIVSPAGPFYAAMRYGPKIIKSIQWLWANKNKPDIIQLAREEMGDTILPGLLTAVQGFAEEFQSNVSSLINSLLQAGTSVLELLGGITGIPLLSIVQNILQSISKGIQSFILLMQSSFQQATQAIQAVFQNVKIFVSPYIEILSSLGMAIANPFMIPTIIAGWAWRLLPDCVKPKVINFLLDIIINLVEAVPSSPFFGLLSPFFKPGLLDFLKEMRAQEDNVKIAITNKFAKIMSGASPDFLIGFVFGLLKGIWEGLTDPFKLIFSAIEGLSNLIDWFMGLFDQPTVIRKITSSDNAPLNQDTISGRMKEMGQDLIPDATNAAENFMPAISEHFQGGNGMTCEQLPSTMGEAWQSSENALSNDNQSLVQKMVGFLMQDSSEREMGEGVGWLAGTIIFEVVLAVLTAGSYTAASGAMKVLKFFARVLDWTGEVMGVAFKALAKLGGYILDAVKGIGKLLSRAGGAARKVMDALYNIGRKLISFAQELMGLSKKSVVRETAEELGEKAAKEASEKAGEEVAEAGIERSGKEAAEEAVEKSARETAEEGGEKGAKKGTDDALKAAELPAALSEAKFITELHDKRNSYIPILLGNLLLLKLKYKWIKEFSAQPKSIPGHYKIIMRKSDYDIDQDYTTDKVDNPKSTDEDSFKGIIDNEAFSKDQAIIDRLDEARQFDIGGYDMLKGRDLKHPNRVGRVGDHYDSDEALQNLVGRERLGVGRDSNVLYDNPAIALNPQLHHLIKNMTSVDIKGLSAQDILRYHLDQMRSFTPHHVLIILERESLQFIKKHGL